MYVQALNEVVVVYGITKGKIKSGTLSKRNDQSLDCCLHILVLIDIGHCTYLVQMGITSFISSKPLALFCGCTVLFVSDLVENHKDRFSHDGTHIICTQKWSNYHVI